MKGKKQPIKRFCYACGSDKTTLTKGKWPSWILNHDKDNNVLCLGCFQRIIYLKKYRARRYTFADKRMYEDKPTRKGVCSTCGIKVGDQYIGWRNKILTVQQTQFHHEFYLVICPWFSRVELCVACHDKIRWEEYRKNYIPEVKVCSLCGIDKNYRSNGWRRSPNGNRICFKCWRKTVYWSRLKSRNNSSSR